MAKRTWVPPNAVDLEVSAGLVPSLRRAQAFRPHAGWKRFRRDYRDLEPVEHQVPQRRSGPGRRNAFGRVAVCPPWPRPPSSPHRRFGTVPPLHDRDVLSPPQNASPTKNPKTIKNRSRARAAREDGRCNEQAKARLSTVGSGLAGHRAGLPLDQPVPRAATAPHRQASKSGGGQRS